MSSRQLQYAFGRHCGKAFVAEMQSRRPQAAIESMVFAFNKGKLYPYSSLRAGTRAMRRHKQSLGRGEA